MGAKVCSPSMGTIAFSGSVVGRLEEELSWKGEGVGRWAGGESGASDWCAITS